VKELRSLLQCYVERGRSTPGPELKIELFVKPGDVRYQGAGYDKLAAQVAAQITAALPEKKAADNR
jgi:hypothetical protein